MNSFWTKITDSDVLRLITAFCAVMAAVTTLMTARAVRVVHIMMNSRLTELLAARTGEAHAEGVAAGRDAAKAEQDTKP